MSEISRWEDKGREFLEESPLLSWAAIRLPGTMKQLDATRPRLTCKPCAGVVPFALFSVGGIAFGRGLSESVMSPQPLYQGPQLLRYVCASCEKMSAEFFIEIQTGRVRKLGQSPPWTVNVSKRVAEFLGDDLTKIYKNGLVCESQGLGIAAFAYYRRVLEDTIDRLLDAIQEVIDDAGERERYADVMKKSRAEKTQPKRSRSPRRLSRPASDPGRRTRCQHCTMDSARDCTRGPKRSASGWRGLSGTRSNTCSPRSGTG